MSTQKPPPNGRKPAPAPTGARRSAPPVGRRVAAPATRGTRRQGRDLFGLYFILSAAAAIFLFGVGVWTLRNLGSGGGVPATATPILLTTLPVDANSDTPLAMTPPPVPTPPAPDAVNSGPFAPSAPRSSVVITDINQVAEPAHLPAVIPQAVLQLSETAVFFGNVNPTSVLTHELTLANEGARDLTITALSTSCACVSASIDAIKLPTGTRTHLLVTYRAALDPSEPGFTAAHTLSIASTDGQNPLTKITVSAVLP